MPQPLLIALLDGVEVVRLVPPPPGGAREWRLAVVAVQATVAAGRPAARLRAHVTGAPAATVIELPGRARVEVRLVEAGAGGGPAAAQDGEAQAAAEGGGRAALPAGAAARLTLVGADGAPAQSALLPFGALAQEPPPRAFGHVFCRWLRDGSAAEPGCDLTPFAAPPAGEGWPRVARRAVRVGEAVVFEWEVAPPA